MVPTIRKACEEIGKRTKNNYQKSTSVERFNFLRRRKNEKELPTLKKRDIIVNKLKAR